MSQGGSPEGRLPVPALWDSGPREPSAAHTHLHHVCVLYTHRVSRATHPRKWTPVTAQQMPIQDQHKLTHPNMPSALNATLQRRAFQNDAGQIQLFLSFSLVLRFQAQRMNMVASKKTKLLWREAWASPLLQEAEPFKDVSGKPVCKALQPHLGRK